VRILTYAEENERDRVDRKAAIGQGKDEKRDRREIWKREPWVVSMKVTHVK